MQIVSKGEDLHEMSNIIFSKKFQNAICWQFYTACSELNTQVSDALFSVSSNENKWGIVSAAAAFHFSFLL